MKIPFDTLLKDPASKLANGRIGVSVMFNESDEPNQSDGGRTTFEVESGQLKNSTLFTDLYLFGAGEYNERLEASASAAVAKAVASESAADIAMARNFVALLADGEAKTELLNRIDAIAAVTYTVTFKDWDGTVLKTETVKRGEHEPRRRSRRGRDTRSRDGATNFTNVTSDMTVTAEYDPCR